VVNSRLDDKTLAEGVLARIGKNFAAIHLHRARSIPRNAAGKVQRQLLGEWLNQRQGKAH
jgi:acyl-CoA synthetase (AMP-forming)/AMP-acid ligase II